VPLLIVVVTASAFTEERARGTLRHLLSLGVQPRTLAIGKALGATLPILFVLVPVLSIGAIGIALSAGVDRWRALALLTSYGLYAAMWIGLGLTVSARARTPQTALAVLLAAWLCGCVLLPKVAFTAVQGYAPIPTAQQFVEQLEADSGEGTGFMEQRAAIEKRLLAQYGVAAAAALPVSTWGVTLYKREVESTKRYNAVFNALFDQYDRQQRAIDVLSTLCPPLAMRTLSMSLAGTDVAHYRHFADAVERYRYTLVQQMNQVAIDSRLYNSRPTFAGGPDRPAFPQGELDAYASVAPFAYERPSLGWAVTHLAIPTVTLVVWLAGLTMLASRAVARIRLD
jgi:ABC-2 type transport system permease protein